MSNYRRLDKTGLTEVLSKLKDQINKKSSVTFTQNITSGTPIALININESEKYIYAATNSGHIYSVTQYLTSGTRIATITINDTSYDLYAMTDGGDTATINVCDSSGRSSAEYYILGKYGGYASGRSPLIRMGGMSDTSRPLEITADMYRDQLYSKYGYYAGPTVSNFDEDCSGRYSIIFKRHPINKLPMYEIINGTTGDSVFQDFMPLSCDLAIPLWGSSEGANTSNTSDYIGITLWVDDTGSSSLKQMTTGTRYMYSDGYGYYNNYAAGVDIPFYRSDVSPYTPFYHNSTTTRINEDSSTNYAARYIYLAAPYLGGTSGRTSNQGTHGILCRNTPWWDYDELMVNYIESSDNITKGNHFARSFINPHVTSHATAKQYYCQYGAANASNKDKAGILTMDTYATSYMYSAQFWVPKDADNTDGSYLWLTRNGTTASGTSTTVNKPLQLWGILHQGSDKYKKMMQNYPFVFDFAAPTYKLYTNNHVTGVLWDGYDVENTHANLTADGYDCSTLFGTS